MKLTALKHKAAQGIASLDFSKILLLSAVLSIYLSMLAYITQRSPGKQYLPVKNLLLSVLFCLASSGWTRFDLHWVRPTVVCRLENSPGAWPVWQMVISLATAVQRSASRLVYCGSLT